MCFLCDLKTQAAAQPPARGAREPMWSARRGFLLAGAASAAAAALPAAAQVDVGRSSSIRQLVPAAELEQAAAQQYAQMMAEARGQGALMGDGNAQLRRLRGMADRLIPHAAPWNDRSKSWRWEVNLIRSDQINAFCMPGGNHAELISSIRERLWPMGDDTVFIPGHGHESSFGQERRHNPFVRGG